jgi:hypothetical protein
MQERMKSRREMSKIDMPLTRQEELRKKLGILPPAMVQNELRASGLEETKEGGTLWKILDVLQRGQYATVGAVEALRHGEDVVEGFTGGLSGRTKGSWVDIVEDVVPGRHPWVEKPMGFALDVVVDPLNLVPMGWVAKAGRLLKLPRLVEHLAKLAPVDSMMKKFKPGWALRNMNVWKLGDEIVEEGVEGAVKHNAYDVYRDLQLELASVRRNIQDELRGRVGEFQKIARKLGDDPAEAEAMLIRLRELGEGDLVKAEYQELYEQVVDGLNSLKDKEIAAGMLNPEKVIKNYFPHIYEHPERGGFFTKLAFRTPHPFFSKAREFKTVDEAVAEIGKWVKQGRAKDIAPVQEFFRGYAIRQYVSDSVFAWRNFVENTLADYGKPFKEMLEEHGEKVIGKPMSQWDAQDIARMSREPLEFMQGTSLVQRIPNLRAPAMAGMEMKSWKDAMQMQATAREALIEVPMSTALKVKGKDVYMLPSELAHEVKKTFKIFTNEETIRGFWQSYDQGMHMWKSMATSMRIPFHARNALSNTWQMYLSGVPTYQMPKRIAQAFQMQFGKGKFFGRHADIMNDLANRYGVRGYGWVAADVPTQFHKELKIIQEAPRGYKYGMGAGKLAMPARAGRRLGTTIEDNARIATWLNRMDELGAGKPGLKIHEFNRIAEEAATHTRKYLFDYTELTPFERSVMKRVLPFYTWMRKNIPLQLESLATQPQKFARLAKFHQDIGPLVLGDPNVGKKERDLMPQYMREMKYMPTQWTDAAGNRVYMHVDLPTEELTKMWQLKNWLSALTPATAIYDIVANVQTWPSAQKIKKYPGQRVTAPWWAAWIPEKVGKFADIGPTTNYATGKQVVGMDPLWRYGLEQAFPFLNDWNRRFPQAGEMQVDDQGKWKDLSYVTGIKFKPLDLKQEAQRKHYKVQAARRAVPKIVRSRGGKVSKEEVLKYLEEMLE